MPHAAHTKLARHSDSSCRICLDVDFQIDAEVCGHRAKPYPVGSTLAQPPPSSASPELKAMVG